jgi:hypothetical protein
MRFGSRVPFQFRWITALLLWLSTTSAQAHPDLDEGKRLVGELEFDAALDAFGRALESHQLSREELISLLSERTLVLHALHRQPELVADFVWLAALEPEHILDMRAPPELVGIWKSVRDQARGPLTVRMVHETAGGQLRVRAELSGTVPADVMTRIGVRPVGGQWEVASGQDQLTLHDAATEYDVYVDAVGPGGLVVARDGSQDAPLRVVAEAPRASAGAGERDDSAAVKRKRRAWIIAGTAAAVVAASLTGFLVARSNSDDKSTVKLTPMVSF